MRLDAKKQALKNKCFEEVPQDSIRCNLDKVFFTHSKDASRCSWMRLDVKK